ncbi:MAG: cryptochrome/photolyase family protein [Lishizhenia sp.]
MNVSIFWHRRDLRINDNAGLYKALRENHKVQPIFIFDKNILDKLPENDQRVLFIYTEIKRLREAYTEFGVDLKVYYGSPEEVFSALIDNPKHTVKSVFTNRDYEPYAKQRDLKIFELLKSKNIEFLGAKDHVIFEKDEVLKDDGTPYRVFTPYSRKWKAKLNAYYIKKYPIEKYLSNFNTSTEFSPLIQLSEMGFKSENVHAFPEKEIPISIVKKYNETRDFPAKKGTSRLSLHLRFGTISVRELVQTTKGLNETYLNEIIWRDFYQMILHHFPHSAQNSFRSEYDQIPWVNNEEHFEAWKIGKTGYPMVDAGMRELNQTGFMHNRVRMIVASFLTKHLLIDWRWGEAYFAEKLLDFELASNVGGWQWAASSGVDAQPYFRIFNPESQLKKFDKEERYIRKWVPEYGTTKYPTPIVEHKAAREKAIRIFKETLS